MHALDLQLFSALNGLAGQSAFLDRLFVFLADYLAYILGAIFLGLLIWSHMPRKEKWELFAVSVASTILARGVITEGIRHFYHRPRPFSVMQVHQLLSDSSWSFPSGHSTFFFALSTAVFLYNRKWGSWFFVATVLITISRVIVGVHYPSDILGGAIIGVFSGYFAYFCLYWYQTRNTHQTY